MTVPSIIQNCGSVQILFLCRVVPSSSTISRVPTLGDRFSEIDLNINWIHPGQNSMMVQKALAFSQLITSAAELSDQCEFDRGPRSPKAISSQKRPHSTHQSRAWLVTQLSVELFNSSQTGILTAFNLPSLSSVNWIFIENQCYTNSLLQNHRRWEGSYVGLASYPSTPMVQQLMQQWNLNRIWGFQKWALLLTALVQTHKHVLP